VNYGRSNKPDVTLIPIVRSNKPDVTLSPVVRSNKPDVTLSPVEGRTTKPQRKSTRRRTSLDLMSL
jgi:hypothetical protein